MTLDRWLDIATHGLAPAAASRVRREYTDAFHDAHDAGEWNVVAGWGDPHRVNRELRRVHLTGREARALHPGYAPTWGGLRRALGEDSPYFGMFGVLALLDAVWVRASMAFLWIGVGFLGLFVLRWLIVSRCWRWPTWRTAAHWLLQPLTVILPLVLLRGADEYRSGGHPLNWLMLDAGSTALEVALRLAAAALLAAHLLRLPTALRAARKLEGEAA